MMGIPAVLLKELQKIEPQSQFSGSLPKICSFSGAIYFAKVGSVAEQEQYMGEAEALKVMEKAAPGLAPRLVACDITDDSAELTPGLPYFLSEYKEMGGLNNKAAGILGKRLAVELHRYKSEHGYGFGVPTYCGATRLANGWFETWEECYSAMIGDLLAQLRRKGRYERLYSQGEEVRTRVIPKLLGSLDIAPVLLHGDLWSGNAGANRTTGQPVIFDPASYFGHNEADLAIARIFGGFPESFFDTYHEHQPKTDPKDQYELRGHLYELFHYLNHTLLFGGHYATSAMSKIDKLLDANSEFWTIFIP